MIYLGALALAAMGCGNGEAEKRIRATLAAQERAFTKLDFHGACAQMTEAARLASPWCAEDTSGATLGNEAIVTFRVKTMKATRIDVDGDTAEVRRKDSGDTTRMRKVDGRWLIDEY